MEHGQNALQGVCPRGWHLPTQADWEVLTSAYTMDQLLANGSNTSGFSGNYMSFNDWNGSSILYLSSTTNQGGLYLSDGSLYSPFNYDEQTQEQTYNADFHLVRCIKGEGATTTPVVILTTDCDTCTEIHPFMDTAAIVNWTTLADGGAMIIDQGVCVQEVNPNDPNWNPNAITLGNSMVFSSHESSLGEAEIEISDLVPGTTYYVRAFATNANGTTYSDFIARMTMPERMGQPCPDAATVTDYDGNTYATVQIGTQCWMKEDLRTTHYANGTLIQRLTNYANMQDGYAYYYSTAPLRATVAYVPGNTNYAGPNLPMAQQPTQIFYFADAVVNGSHDPQSPMIQGVCPQGWHVPTLDEWGELYAYLGNDYLSKLSVNGSNVTGFDGSGGCGRSEYNGELITSVANDPFYFCYFSSDVRSFGGDLYLMTNNSEVTLFNHYAELVRCIKGNGMTTKPQPKTVAANDVTSTTANLWGENCTDGGASITSYGVCWSSENQQPTTADSSHSFNSDYIGRYYYMAENLLANTTYYFRTFATNANGTVYSDSVISFTTSVMMNQPCPDAAIVTDYDGNVYNTVQIGNQCWMKEDLRTKHFANGTEIHTIQDNKYMARYYSLLDDIDGLLYPSNTVLNGGEGMQQPVQGVCPQGWHVPSREEYMTLFNTLGGLEEALPLIKSTNGWPTPGTNASGFNLKKTGRYMSGTFYSENVLLQTSTRARKFHVLNDELSTAGESGFYDDFGTVRCIKGDGNTSLPVSRVVDVTDVASTTANLWAETCTDGGADLTEFGVCWSSENQLPTTSDNTMSAELNYVCRYYFAATNLTPNTTYYFRSFATNANGTSYSDSVKIFTTPNMMGQSCPDADSVVDYDGNVYNTVQIGKQCWMKENLRTTHYANGKGINQHYAASYYPRYYELRRTTDGYLYPLFTVLNGTSTNEPAQGICPAGWHVPSYEEYQTLFNTLGGNEEALSLLKADNRWNTPGTNASGFNLLPVGEYYYGNFSNEGTLLQTSTLAYKWMIYDNEIHATGESSSTEDFGSVRCIKGDGLPSIPTARIIFVDSVTSTTAQVNGELQYDGGVTITRWGVAIGTEPFPVDQYVFTTDTNLGGSTFHLENLTPNTHYYVRIFATNAAGTNYSENMEFTTPEMPTSPVTGPCPDAPIVTDMDGNVYNTVQIGSQCWMKENLRTTLFADGREIDPENGNNPARYMEPDANYRYGYTPGRYGFFYNYAAATNNAPHNHSEAVQGVCPQGWHLPDRSEWQTLYATAASYGDAAAALTENSAFWTDGSEHTNITGFSARPGSYAYASYDTTGNAGFGKTFYYATADFNSEAMVAEMYYAATCINGQLDFTSMATNIYMPVRCIKGEGVSSFAPTLEIEYSGITTSEVSIMGEYAGNGHNIMDFELYMGTNPNDLVQATYGTPYYGGGQWNYFWLYNLTPNTTYYVQMCLIYDNAQRLCVEGSFTTESD